VSELWLYFIFPTSTEPQLAQKNWKLIFPVEVALRFAFYPYSTAEGYLRKNGGKCQGRTVNSL